MKGINSRAVHCSVTSYHQRSSIVHRHDWSTTSICCTSALL